MLNHVFWELWRWRLGRTFDAFLRMKRTIGIFWENVRFISRAFLSELLRRIYDKALIQLLQHLTLTFYQKHAPNVKC